MCVQESTKAHAYLKLRYAQSGLTFVLDTIRKYVKDSD